MDLNYLDIGQRIKKLRISRKMTQDKLAEQVNLSTPHMSHIEQAAPKSACLHWYISQTLLAVPWTNFCVTAWTMPGLNLKMN